jgi:catechol 2,3-dioxygenase-like lactoylglutathione lyase family enzyme
MVNVAGASKTSIPYAVKHIHHHAFACRDSEETRHFYEDILGMPLVATVVLEDPFLRDGSRYCHTFFEMADGNALAFFEHTSLFKPDDFLARSGFHHHVALEVEGDDAVMGFKAKLDAAGIANEYMDHGVFHSLYFNDPNGLNLEFVTRVPATAEYDRASRLSARRDLAQWLQDRPSSASGGEP